MLAPALVAEVRRLLAEGKHAQRTIARMVGVSRTTVSEIALGRRPEYAGRPEEYAPGCESAGPPQWCAGCGGMVYLPCRLCDARRIAAHTPRPLQNIAEDEPPVLQLKAEHRRRYERIRAVRQSAPSECPAAADGSAERPQSEFPDRPEEEDWAFLPAFLQEIET